MFREYTKRHMVVSLWLSVSVSALALPASDPWADRVVAFSPSLDGSGLYNDPQSVLGPPTTTFYDPTLRAQFKTSLVVGAFNLDAPEGRKVVCTLNRGDFIKVRFDEPVRNDPKNPYGIDLLVFGNAFFVHGAFIRPDTDLEAVRLNGPLAGDFPVMVAVSATGEGDPQTNPQAWYVYQGGPFADADLFPTNTFAWDRCRRAFGQPLNLTKPVDPALTPDDFRGKSAADAIDLYGASGGGAGFDLAESGFDWIQYVYVTSTGGEVDAMADVTPGVVGPGDADLDADVDLADFRWFQACYTASGRGPVDCGCRSVDIDGDDDVDLDDLRLWAERMTGP